MDVENININTKIWTTKTKKPEEAMRQLDTIKIKSSFQSLLDRRNMADLPSPDAQDRLKLKSGM